MKAENRQFARDVDVGLSKTSGAANFWHGDLEINCKSENPEHHDTRMTCNMEKAPEHKRNTRETRKGKQQLEDRRGKKGRTNLQ